MSLERPLKLVVCFLYALGVGGTGVKIKSGMQRRSICRTVCSVFIKTGDAKFRAGPWRRQDEC